MKTKFRWCSQVVAAFAIVLAPGSGTAQAATCTVPLPYATIQAAVNDVTCSIINVAAGPYAENVNINRALTLNGAQAGTPAPGRVAAESTVTGANPIGANPVIAINAPNVVVNGFTLKNPVTTGAAIGIAVNAAGSGALIVNNIIDTITTIDIGANGTAQAIYLQNGPDNVTIVANEMKNIQSARSAKGVLVVGRPVFAGAASRAHVTKALVNRACHRTVRACHGIIVPSQAGARYIRRQYGVSADKVAVIPLGLDEAFLSPDIQRSDGRHGARLFMSATTSLSRGRMCSSRSCRRLGIAYPTRR